jgi:hypothetical protein
VFFVKESEKASEEKPDKDEVCFKRKREERMVKEWANKDKYHPSDGVLEPRM